jgi:hypothetical protein
MQDGEAETGTSRDVRARRSRIQDCQLRAQGLEECRAGEVPGQQ